MRIDNVQRRLSACALVSLACLAGCSLSSTSLPSKSSASPLLTGRVMGGQQPVNGALIQLYAVNLTQDGGPSTPLLTTTVRSDVYGGFTITHDYTCPSASALVYITATGGDAGVGNNPALAMMSAIGACGTLTPSTGIQIDERTTVAAVAALAPYMASYTAVGSSPLDATALSAAFTLATSLVDTGTATVPGPALPANATAPAALINSLANITAACINSNGSTLATEPCGQLFNATTEPGATAPVNAIGALLNLMRDPVMNAATLFALPDIKAPFQPALISPPSSWTVALSGPGAPAAPPSGCSAPVATGGNAFTNFKLQQPQTCRHLTSADLPAPFASSNVNNTSSVVARTASQMPIVPPGFKVTLYATNLYGARSLYTAPNGDLFVVQAANGSVTVLRGVSSTGAAAQQSTFASNLNGPYGLAFYPAGPNPHFVYISNTTAVFRFPYAAGDTTASAPPTVLLSNLPGGGNHTTRGLLFTPDGQHLLVSVGSAGNVDDNPNELDRADILSYTPAGVFESIYASGLRNPVNLAAGPNGTIWTAVNERDTLGDNLPSDYVTHVVQNGFYGWPWYYNGPHADPFMPMTHPELAAQTITGDVLLQAHFAPLQLNFYTGANFPAPYRGDLFVAAHGSWNKSVRGGYEVLRAFMSNGVATGAYEDFMTGFVNADGTVWGRPAGVVTGADGALYVADDAGNCVWRVIYTGATN